MKKKLMGMFIAVAWPSIASAQSQPSLPADLPDDYATIGGLAFLAEAAHYCLFRNEAWTQAVMKDAAHASDKFLGSIYPNGVPDQVTEDAELYVLQEAQAAVKMTHEQCETLQQSGLLSVGDAAAANASN